MPANLSPARLGLWVLVLANILVVPSYSRPLGAPVRGRATARVVRLATLQPDVKKILQRDTTAVAPGANSLARDVVAREERAPGKDAPGVILVEVHYQ